MFGNVKYESKLSFSFDNLIFDTSTSAKKLLNRKQKNIWEMIYQRYYFIVIFGNKLICREYNTNVNN